MKAHNIWLFGIALVVLICLLIGIFFNQWRADVAQIAPVDVQVPATPAPEVAKAEPVSKPLKTTSVKAYPASVKNALKLPQNALDNPALDVIASTQVQADKRPQTITTLLNTETGEVETYARRDPLPWIAAQPSGQAGLFYLQRQHGQVLQLSAQQSLVQIKGVHVGVKGSIEQPLTGPGETAWAAGVGVWVEW